MEVKGLTLNLNLVPIPWFPVPSSSFVYQDALRTPGISPFSAISRKQMRHSPNLRRNARGRPQRVQRWIFRLLNFGFLFAFSTSAFFAIRFRLVAGFTFALNSQKSKPDSILF